ncbi:30S ribosomal protein S2 [Amnibacterium setariae]|uniref:Small ribosomal subunit protein uS2 n=1 Tax=Amnibacterium setariae TaxID=2306585 RepID=A0A3A1U092_9MICO|nr:30S ribosomal protein S2 [Amnibacterium setariae]RIX28345.1 30S ribosomal protein S2 [Amnibacterium setariae]
MAVVTIRQLLDSGVHFGHQTRRWNPKVKRFILTERSGIHIIDLQQSLTYIDRAYDFVKETVARGGTVLFVGTKKQAQESIAEQATRVGQPYVNQRWLGGLLTNFQTVAKRLNRLKELDLVDFDDTSKGYTKKELLIQRRERDKLEKTLGGIRNLTKTPSAMWVIDSKREHLAVDEAKKLGIPVIGILDTNADPDELAYPIPGNDDAIRSVALLTRIIADAAAEGLIQRHQGTNQADAEPLAEWEQELLQATENPEALSLQVEQVDDRVTGQTADTQDRIDTVVADQADASAGVAAATADVAPAEPTEENDADAQADADLAAETVEGLVPEHAPQTEADVEAEELAKSTPAQRRPAKVTDPAATEDPEPSA